MWNRSASALRSGYSIGPLDLDLKYCFDYISVCLLYQLFSSNDMSLLAVMLDDCRNSRKKDVGEVRYRLRRGISLERSYHQRGDQRLNINIILVFYATLEALIMQLSRKR